MVSWKLTDIAKAVNGEIVNLAEEEKIVKGFQQDSRKIEKDFLFVPLVAERDGHDYIKEAREAGAVASFWSEDLKDAPKDFPLILVEDSLDALQQTAQWYLKNVNPKVIAITGSNGKTTTKDMVNKVLEKKYQTHKTAGNFNNHIGLPLTILGMAESTEIAILEMGTSNPGEIQFLSNLVEPDLAVVTMVGESHIESFGTRENLAKEKLSIVSALKKDGLFICPANEPLIQEMVNTNIYKKTFSITEKADIYANNIVEMENSTSFKVFEKEDEEGFSMEIPIPGSYNVNNALIAILIGLEFGVSLEEAKDQLVKLKITKNRLEWVEGIKEWSILNDAYNASPSSVRAVVTYFEALDIKESKILVLGDILELGEFSESLHEGLVESIHPELYDFIFLYGVEMKALYQKLLKEKNAKNIFYFKNDKRKLLQNLKEKVKKSSYILFKSSNGTNLLSLVDDLRVK